MTKEPFIQPRFVGARFEEHTLPVSAAKDLAAYEELVLELARHLFRQKQQTRIRVPKGFASDFSLHIERIDEGSAKPALVAMMVGVQLFSNLPIEITEAKELINEVIATEEGQAFPMAFPKDLYSYFNRVGRSLKDGEQIQWTPESPNNQTVLTPAKRIRLASAHRETYQAEADIVGLVESLDVKKKCGTLRTLSEDAIPFVYDDPFFVDLKEALGNSVIYTQIKGVGLFDVNDRLSLLTEIDHVECLPHYRLVLSIEALSELSDGWLEGTGIAPKPKHLDWLANEVAKSFPESLEYPSVVPTEDGHVIFEWIRPHARMELEFNFTDQKLELYATNLLKDEFVEESFDLERWEEPFRKVSTLLQA